MPTGYNACIVDGTITSLREWIHTLPTRDEGPAFPKEGPRFMKPQKHLEEQVKSFGKALKDLEEKSEKEIQVEQDEEYKENLKLHRDSEKQRQLVLKRIADMEAQVNAWEPGGVHGPSWKDLLKGQLAAARKENSYSTFSKEPTRPSASQWKKEQESYFKRMLKSYQNDLDEDIKRCKTHNEFVTEFYKTLPKD